MAAKEKNFALYMKSAAFYDQDPRPDATMDTAFFLEYAGRLGGNILELAAGTGRVAIPIAEAGHQIWALEISESMLTVLREKSARLAPETVLRIHPVQQDMTAFKIPQRFGLIIVPFRSFGVLLEAEQQHACLKCVYDHLEEDGLFIINFMAPPPADAQQWVNPEPLLDWDRVDPVTGNRVRRSIVRREIDTERQRYHVDLIYDIHLRDGSVEQLVEKGTGKYNTHPQQEELLRSNGFEVVERYGDYHKQPIANDGESVYVCRRKG